MIFKITNFRTLLSVTLSSVLLLSLFVVQPVFAQGITNPVISKNLGSDQAAAASGKTLSSYIITIWRALIVVGSLAVLLNFVTGAINWITAGGDQGKVTKARQQITEAVIGMVILVFSFTIINFALGLFGIDVLRMTIPKPS